MGKLPALGQLWKQLGFVPAVQKEGELRAIQGVYQAGAGAACRLPQSPAACVSGEKNFCPELWSSRDSLRGLVQLLMALITIGMKESDM